jgi:hypothetical protein
VLPAGYLTGEGLEQAASVKAVASATVTRRMPRSFLV